MIPVLESAIEAAQLRAAVVEIAHAQFRQLWSRVGLALQKVAAETDDRTETAASPHGVSVREPFRPLDVSSQLIVE